MLFSVVFMYVNIQYNFRKMQENIEKKPLEIILRSMWCEVYIGEFF